MIFSTFSTKSSSSRTFAAGRLYGQLEQGFGLAFAIGGIVSGFIADRISPRWLSQRSSSAGPRSASRRGG